MSRRTLKSKGSYFDGLRTRVRYGWVKDLTGVGDKKSSDLRIDVNLPINLLRRSGGEPA